MVVGCDLRAHRSEAELVLRQLPDATLRSGQRLITGEVPGTTGYMP